MPEIGVRIYIRLSPAHIGYARVRQADGEWRFYYDVEEPVPTHNMVPWRAGVLTIAAEGQTWCHDNPEEIVALNVVEALR